MLKGRWHSPQCFRRIGATSSANVTRPAGGAAFARVMRQPSTGVSATANSGGAGEGSFLLREKFTKHENT